MDHARPEIVAMSMLHGPAETPVQGESENSRPMPRCPECMQPYSRVHPRQLFCCPAHQTTFNNRQTVRGRQLVPLVMAERIGRGGWKRGSDPATAIAARQDSRVLIDRWAADDRAAGRMSMLAFIRLRRANGYDTVL